MEEKTQQMFKSKICATIQEVIFPEFPEDDNTVTTTVTKSRRVSFGTNFIKEFIVGSAVSATCVSEYEQAFSSSDSSNPNSSHSAVENDPLDHAPTFITENPRIRSTSPAVSKPPHLDSMEQTTQMKFSKTICFGADSATADMELTEGCAKLAKMTKTRQSKLPEKDFMMEDSKENQMPLNLIMRQLDKDDSNSDLFNQTSMSMSMEIENQESRTKENRIPLNVIMRQLDKDDTDSDIFNPVSMSMSMEIENEENVRKENKIVLNSTASQVEKDDSDLFSAVSMSMSMEVETRESSGERNVTDSPHVEQTGVEESPRESVHNGSEPLLVDVKMIEDLEEQSKESNCTWTLKDVRYPDSKTLGLLTFDCTLLQSSTTLQFTLKKSEEEFCSVITESSVCLTAETSPPHPEYGLVLDFGFKKQEEYFNEQKQKIRNIRNVPFFLDEINSFMIKINSYLKQVYEVLISYPGSSLTDAVLSFRLFSYPIFFSATVSIDLTNLFRLTESSLSFKRDIGRMDEKKIRSIFQDCLKRENCLCEFVIGSCRYLFDVERGTGLVSKRSHIRLLPAELRV